MTGWRKLATLLLAGALVLGGAACPTTHPKPTRKTAKVKKRDGRPTGDQGADPTEPGKHPKHGHRHAPHPHEASDHHHHAHPHPHLDGPAGHHHPY
jgi:hypothetical protein